MAAIFTPGLKVTEHGIVHKDRRLPLEGVVTVRVGDRVEADQVVARTELPGKIYPANLANKLGVDAGRLKEFLLKGEGRVLLHPGAESTFFRNRVADLAEGGGEVAVGGSLSREGERRRAGTEVDRDFVDAVQSEQGPLCRLRAGLAGHAGDREGEFLRGDGGTG